MRPPRFAARQLGVKFETPIFDGAHWNDVKGYMAEANLDTVKRVQNCTTADRARSSIRK